MAERVTKAVSESGWILAAVDMVVLWNELGVSLFTTHPHTLNASFPYSFPVDRVDE